MKDEGKTTKRRHDLSDVYKRNCAIYLTKVKVLMGGDLFGRISRGYVMPLERSVDINDAADLRLAEFFAGEAGWSAAP